MIDDIVFDVEDFIFEAQIIEPGQIASYGFDSANYDFPIVVGGGGEIYF